jgi:2-methylcitrate dehydratase
VASAAAAALLDDLGALATRHAMSLAVTPNFALQATRLGTLSMWKGCASANACRNGVFAAELAGRGLTGPQAPFDGRGGLFPITGEEPDMRGLLRADGRPAISDCHIKRYPSGYFSQGAIEAAVQARASLRSSQEIERIEIGTFEFGLRVMAGDSEKWRPATRETADHSIPFVVACAVAAGDVTSASFRPDVLADPEIRRLLDRLTVAADAECAAAWPEACMNKVTLVLTNGERRSATVRYYRGHARNPMSDEEVQRKFARQAAPVLGDTAAGQLATVIWGLDKAGHISELFDAAATAEDS